MTKKKSDRGSFRAVPKRLTITLTDEQAVRFAALPSWVNQAGLIRDSLDRLLDEVEAKLWGEGRGAPDRD